MKILVVEASGLHLGFLGCYGNDWVATPELDRIAAEGIVFDQHFADCPTPAPSGPPAQRSSCTGMFRFPGAPAVGPSTLDPALIRHETVEGLLDFGKRVLALVKACRKAGPPILWIDGPDLFPPWRLPDEMLCAYVDEEDEDALPLGDPTLGLASLDGDYFDRLQMAYAAVATSFDAQLGYVLDDLRHKDWLDQILVCVTARCGLPLGEHGMTGIVRPWLHDELAHIPLIVRSPGGGDGGLRVPALTQPADLLPTWRESLGLTAAPVHGYALWPLIHGTLETVRPYAVSGLRIGEAEEWLLRTPELALLVPSGAPLGALVADPPRQTQLYAKPEDRWEVNDVAPRHSEQTDALTQTLRTFVAATNGPGPLAYPPLPAETVIVEETS